MSDFKSQLPIRTLENDDVTVAIGDGVSGGNIAGVDSNGDLCVKAKLTDSSGTNIDGSNPLPVITEKSPCNSSFSKATDLAVDATSDHDYAPGVAGKVVGLVMSASGCGKYELQVGAVASETTRMVFFTSAAQPSAYYAFPCGISVSATDNIKLIRTNGDEQAQCMYTTIEFVND